jgi:mRNA interferase RelE/StbE
LKELVRLPKDIRKKAEAIAFEEISDRDPFSLGYIEKMKGYGDKFKIRLGDYRNWADHFCQRQVHHLSTNRPS